MAHWNRDTDVRRIALAAAVGVLSLLAALGVAIALSGGSPKSGAVAKAPPSMPGATALDPERVGHGMSVPGMTEHQLREFEIATLGPEHAAEHAEMRRAARVDKRTREQLGPSHPVAKIAAAGPPAEVGRWDPSATVTFGVVAIHAAMLPTGKVMIFSYPKDPQENSTRVYLWDPKSDPDGTHMVRRDPPLWQDPKDGVFKAANIWCSGHTFTADGELVVFGGNLQFPDATASPPTDYKGLNKVYTFDPFTETWHEQPDMAHGRWYPTGIRMADGRIPILSGWDESGLDKIDEDVEIFNPPSTIGGTGSIAKIGETSLTDDSKPPTGEFYPHMFAMPSGRTLIVGPDQFNTWFMNTPTASSFTWSAVPPLDQRRLWGTAVPVPGSPNKVMALGGTNESTIHSTNTTAVFDESNAGAGWQAAPSNVIGRGHANTVLLPDGSMVEVGGGYGSDASVPGYATGPLYAANLEQRQIELWDPSTGQWKLGPAQAESRAYHSTALLLPDGRVMSAGDDFNGGIQSDTAEIYEPPYLHKGVARPSIDSVQANVKLGTHFAVNTPDENITKASLMAPSAVTHAVDMNERYVPLQVSQHDGCVELTAPSSANAAPPGWYMLFLLNDSGVPSEAKWVKLGSAGSASSCGGPPVDGVAPTVSVTAPANGATVAGTISVTAAATDNVGGTGVAGVQLVLDGQSLGGELTSGPYTRSWNTNGVADGHHELKAVARDGAGNTRTSAIVGVNVTNHPPDTTAPSVSVSAPAPGSTLSGTVGVQANAADNAGVAGVQFKLDGANLGAEDTSSPYAIDWSTTAAANGGHQLTAVARDAAGNKTTSAAVPVTVANTGQTASTVWLTAPAAGAKVAGKTTLSAAANGSLPVAGMRFLVDGKLVGTDTQAPYSLIWDTTSVANGSHKLGAVAADQEGNTRSSALVGVTVANPTKGSPPPPDAAPAISRLKLSSSSFRRSATISFRLSEAARVTVSFERKLSGRKRHGKCQASAKRGARCTAYRKLSSKISVEGTAGVNSLRLGRRGMPAGSYRLTLVATDSAGKRSLKARTGFRLVGAATRRTRAAAIETAIRSVQLAF